MSLVGEIETESDVWNLEELFREFEQEREGQRKVELCKKACDLYQGEFLPQLSNEQWVIERSRHYQKLYFGMLRYLLSSLKEEGDYRSIEKVAAQAVSLYPYEGWEIWQIDSLIALGRQKEAQKLYQKTASYVQEIGGFLSKKQQAQFRRIGGRMQQPEGTGEDIGRCLMENGAGQGAYACTLPGFSDCFRMLKRIVKRGGVQFCLLLCTILDNNGHPASSREYCRKQGEKLRATFQTHLRQGDIYTKYSEGQYLLLCVGVERENIPDIGIRIDMDYRKRCGGRSGINCRLLDDGEIW